VGDTARTVRIGIIGSGGIAAAHAERYRRIPGVEVVAVCDVVPGRAQAFIERHGLAARAYDDHRRLLEADLDGVSVCTFNRAHHGPTVDALRAGKHVLVEKPMAVTLAEAVEMAEAAARAGRILTIGFQSRYEPEIEICKRVMDSGALGRVYYVETGGGRRRGIPGGTFIRRETAGGGAILDIGCYSLDTAMHLLGHPRPLTVSAAIANPFGRSAEYARAQGAGWGGGWDPATFDVEDFGVAFVRLEGDITLVFKIAWAMHTDSLGKTQFLGDRGGLQIDASGGTGDEGVRALTLFHDEAGGPARTELPLGRRRNTDAFLRKLEEFVRAIREGLPAPIPGSQVLRSMAIIDGIYRSAEAEREVDVPAV
jgi:predicted dehydrogenase